MAISSLAAADEFSGPGRKTLVNEEWGTIFCAENCTVKADAMGTRQRILTEKGPISLAKSIDGWLLQAPNQNLRLRATHPLEGGSRLQVLFNAKSYSFELKGNDYRWNFPEDRVFFTMREGELRGALGNQGAYKMHKHTGGLSYQVESEAGASEVLVARKKQGKSFRYMLVQQTGEELARHPYLVRGVLFENGPVGVYIRMPKNPVLEALDWSMVNTIASTIAFPEAKAPVVKEKARDPLQAVEAGRDEDPLGLKRKPYSKDKSMTDLPTAPAAGDSDPEWSVPPK